LYDFIGKNTNYLKLTGQNNLLGRTLHCVKQPSTKNEDKNLYYFEKLI